MNTEALILFFKFAMEVEDYLLQLLSALYTSNATHAMFGQPTAGLVRAPYQLINGRGEEIKRGTSWRNIVRNIVRRFPTTLVGLNECWMVRTNTYQIATTTGAPHHTPINLRAFRIVRLLAFLKQPSDINWFALSTGSEERPFDHFCQRGEASDALQGGAVCINGIEHGEFADRVTNESRKLCKNGAAALCPGHGDGKRKCIFTFPNGKVMYCRNQITHVPKCTCIPLCF